MAARHYTERGNAQAELGHGSIMVLGSGKQRNAIDGSTIADATRRLRDGLAEVAPHARSRDVLLLPEPLRRIC
ncbi:MAG: hypothetical protein ACRD7E_18825 [Bryobacteraceae bacterium]